MNELLNLLPLYLGDEEKNVRDAIKSSPAALFFWAKNYSPSSNPFHLVFDWDSTLCNEDGDNLILEKGRAAFCSHEWDYRHIPHKPGIMYPVFMAALAQPKFTTSILTARTGREAHRVLKTLEHWDLLNCNLHFSGNKNKGAIAAAIGADLFFDDILRHMKDAVEHGVNSAWVPIGNAKE